MQTLMHINGQMVVTLCLTVKTVDRRPVPESHWIVGLFYRYIVTPTSDVFEQLLWFPSRSSMQFYSVHDCTFA